MAIYARSMMMKDRWTKDMRLRSIIDKVKAFGRRVQTIVVLAGLAITYIVGFGATKLWILFFHRRLLITRVESDESFWLEATDHEFDDKMSERQS